VMTSGLVSLKFDVFYGFSADNFVFNFRIFLINFLLPFFLSPLLDGFVRVIFHTLFNDLAVLLTVSFLCRLQLHSSGPYAPLGDARVPRDPGTLRIFSLLFGSGHHSVPSFHLILFSRFPFFTSERWSRPLLPLFSCDPAFVLSHHFFIC